jgi:diaminohydroxyphosphoribosylaminopyrimidine deaminase/5-amino-6-(5-phosphoribosylamino)uracil reductase
MVESADARFMARALTLAERGRGRTSPNPIVGAVVVSPDGVVVGQGAHLEAGGPHAEVHALDLAGDRAHGATIYVTLEPCSHTGRTGPCVERIVAAGISRVVFATRDPNPRVSGGGAAYLLARGVAVTEGVAEAEAQRQNAPFFTWVTQHRAFVTLKMAVSSDGYVGRPRRRTRLTGAAADAWLHRQRAEVDALIVGAETVLIDDPRLTARGVFRYRPLTRVVVDWRARVPETAAVYGSPSAGPVLMVVSAVDADRRCRRFELGAWKWKSSVTTTSVALCVASLTAGWSPRCSRAGRRSPPPLPPPTPSTASSGWSRGPNSARACRR